MGQEWARKKGNDVNEKPAWLIFYGTLTTTIRAATEDEAYCAFVAAHNPQSKHGRYVPPARDEVSIRQPLESDRGWIEESGDRAFLALLAEVVR